MAQRKRREKKQEKGILSWERKRKKDEENAFVLTQLCLCLEGDVEKEAGLCS